MKGRWLPTLAVLQVLSAAPQQRDGASPEARQIETGIASWYGFPYHGRQAANGEVFDMDTLTAAHPWLPFNTWVRVRNLDNEKSVEVRITDRGPFIEGRVIDLSRAAARAIGMEAPGTAPVRLEILEKLEPVVSEDHFAVQIGAFANRITAERLRAELQQVYGVARITATGEAPVLWRVWVGSEAGIREARALAERVRQHPAGSHGFVVRTGE